MPKFNSLDLVTAVVKCLLKTKKPYKETGYLRFISQNELGKSCFEHGIAYKNF